MYFKVNKSFENLNSQFCKCGQIIQTVKCSRHLDKLESFDFYQKLRYEIRVLITVSSSGILLLENKKDITLTNQVKYYDRTWLALYQSIIGSLYSGNVEYQ